MDKPLRLPEDFTIEELIEPQPIGDLSEEAFKELCLMVLQDMEGVLDHLAS